MSSVVHPSTRGRNRGTSGCLTCRIRRVKCDEEKPYCLRCTSTGRKCEGYPNVPIPRPSRTESPAGSIKQIVMPVFDNDQQRLSFEFFVTSTCNASTAFYGGDFWSYRVLQLGLSEPAIRYAVCALSSLHRWSRATRLNFKNDDTISPDELRNFSLQQYTKAISHTQELLIRSSTSTEDIAKGLVVCVLFVCYENFLANYVTAKMHLQNGLRIVRNSCQCSQATRQGLNIPSTATAIPEDITKVLCRLDLQAMCFSDSSALYAYDSYPENVDFQFLESQLTSDEEATSFLIATFRWIFQIANVSEPYPIPQSELDNAAIGLMQWKIKFLAIQENAPEEGLKKQQRRVILLKIYHAILTILVDTKVYGHEMLHDQHIELYSEIVALGKTILKLEQKTKELFFSFEIGIIFPLFFTAIKCRNPWVRREAITLLERMNHVEGTWGSSAAATVAWFVVEVEEGDLEPCMKAEQIVETARVQQVDMRILPQHGRIDISCVLSHGSIVNSSIKYEVFTPVLPK